MSEQTNDIEPKPNKPWQFQKGNVANTTGNNGRNNVKEFKEKLKALDFDTIAEAVNLFRTTDKDKVKCDILVALLARQYAALKAVEISADIGTHFSLQILQKTELEISEAKKELQNENG